jgi:hypothetical protein
MPPEPTKEEQKAKRLARLCLVVLLYLGTLSLTFSAAGFLVPPSVYSDSGWGFLALKSWHEGAPFNNLAAPNNENISQDRSYFLTWWSPGQYLIPALFLDANRNHGRAIGVTVLLFSLLGLTGCYVLYKRLGFSTHISLLSCAVIASSRFFALPFSIYNGGEVLLFGAFGWLLYAALRCAKLRWWHLLLLPTIFLLGAFLKLSFVICSVGILCTLVGLKVARSPARELSTSGIKVYALKLAIAWSAFYTSLYLLFMSKGPTPASGLSIQQPVKALLFSFAAPLLSTFSLGDLLSRVFSNPNRMLIPRLADSYLLLVTLSLLTLWLLFSLRRLSPSLYQIVLFSFFAVYFVVMAGLFIKGARVSFEDRYFRPVGLLLLPGILTTLANTKTRWLKLSGIAFVALCCIYGVFSYTVRWRQNQQSPRGRSGISLATISPRSLNILQSLDETLPAKSAVFYVTSPEIALEVKRQRTIVSHADFQHIAELRDTSYYGKVDNLVVILSRKIVREGKAQAILESFRDYEITRWEKQEIDEVFIYSQHK